MGLSWVAKVYLFCADLLNKFTEILFIRQMPDLRIGYY
jgi:hypothetical protein